MPAQRPPSDKDTPVETKRVALVTPDAGLRRRTAEILAGSRNVLVVETGGLEDDARVIADARPGIVIHAERLPEDQRSMLRRFLPECRRVALVNGEDAAVIAKLVKDGVSGIVRLDDLERALVPTIAAACAGQLAVPWNSRAAVSSPLLSKREKQVLAMLVMGFANAEIAAKLFLTESTVKSHLHSAYRKMAVRSRKEAVALILDPEVGLGTGILAISGSEGTARLDASRAE